MPTHDDVADPRLLRFLQLMMASDAVVDCALILRVEDHPVLVARGPVRMFVLAVTRTASA
jgi:hypothetical protein